MHSKFEAGTLPLGERRDQFPGGQFGTLV